MPLQGIGPVSKAGGNLAWEGGGVSGRHPPLTPVCSPHLCTGRHHACPRAPRGTSGPQGWRSWDPPSASSRRTCRKAARRQVSRRAGGWRPGSPCRRSRWSHLQNFPLLNSSTLPPPRERAPVTWVTSGPKPSLSRRLGPSTEVSV